MIVIVPRKLAPLVIKPINQHARKNPTDKEPWRTILEQFAIAVTGVIAIWFSQEKNDLRKWACIFGMIGQPFWFYAAYTNEQWGIFILSFFYCFAWLKGFRNYWLLDQPVE